VTVTRVNADDDEDRAAGGGRSAVTVDNAALHRQLARAEAGSYRAAGFGVAHDFEQYAYVPIVCSSDNRAMSGGPDAAEAGHVFENPRMKRTLRNLAAFLPGQNVWPRNRPTWKSYCRTCWLREYHLHTHYIRCFN